MESLIILIPLSLLAVLCAVWIFFRMSNSGQFDDDQGPAWSVILDDDTVEQRVSSSREKNKANNA